MRKGLQAFIVAAMMALCAHQVEATSFTAGDLAVYQADPTTLSTNTTITIVEINPTNVPPNPVQSISINGTSGSNALRTSGSATSNGLLARSDNHTLLSFTGHNSTTATGNANLLLPRGVGTLDAGGNFNLATTYTGGSGNQTRGATSLNNSDWYIGDQGGVYTNGGTTASPSANIRGIKSFGGIVYTLQQSPTATNIVVSTVSAPSGGTITGLPGLTNNNTALDFYLVSSGTNGSAYDELYITTTSGISKFSLAGGTWVANGSAAVSGGLYGIAAAVDPLGGADLYATAGSGGATGNSVVKFVDSAGWNSSISLGASTTLYTAPTGAVNKGIEFVPVAVPEPASGTLLALGLLGGVVAVRRRSNRR
jgi:hypothetical protein